jgi:hypothetical protein
MAEFPRHRRTALFPVEPAGDHKVKDHKELVFQFEHDALTYTVKRRDLFSFRSLDRRIERAQYERAGYAYFLQRLVQQSILKRFDVNGDIGKFRHGQIF